MKRPFEVDGAQRLVLVIAVPQAQVLNDSDQPEAVKFERLTIASSWDRSPCRFGAEWFVLLTATGAVDKDI